MIIECESCHTRFRLAKERIPATGAKVRCSRCKTAFVVQPPGATRAQIVEEVVAEVTGSGGTPAPGATEDLFETTSEPDSSDFGAGGRNLDTESSDEKWEFDEAPATSQSAALARAPEPASVGAAGDEEDLDALGSPEAWDLLGGAAKKIAEGARFAEPTPDPRPAPRAPRAALPEPRLERSAVRSFSGAIEETPPALAHETRPALLAALRSAAQSCIDSSVWIASVALCCVGLALAFSPRPERSATLRNVIPAVLGEQSLELTLHRVESGVGGTLAVVRGQLPEGGRASGPTRLRVRWMDSRGAPIAGASAVAGPPAARNRLRELSAERLQGEAELRALGIAASGPFEAIFPALPPGATSISLTREPVPAAARTATRAARSEAEAATASSGPAARPSSE